MRVQKPQGDASSAKDAGFMLLEVIVAFIIAALALGALYQAALTGLHSARTASRYEQALSRARSRLIIAGHGAPLASEDLRGDDGGGFRWRLRAVPIETTAVRPFDPAGLRRSDAVPVTLYAVSVWVSWHDLGVERFVRLNTERIGQAER